MLLTVFRFLPGKGLAARAGVLALVLLAICAPFAALAAPRQQAPGNGPVIFVPNDGFATVTLRDASSLDVRASAYLPTPNTSAINHSLDGSLLFLANQGFTHQLEIVDVATQNVLASVELPFRGLSNCNASSVLPVNENTKIYVACEGNGLVEVAHYDPLTNALVLGTPIFTGWPQSLQLVGGYVFVSDTQHNMIKRIDPQTDVVDVVIPHQSYIFGDAVVDPFRPYAYVVNQFGGRLLIANTHTQAISRTLEFDGMLVDLLLAPNGDHLYVTVDGGNEHDYIAVVDGLGEAESVIATIPVGPTANFLASNDEGTCLYTWDFVDGARRVDVIDTTHHLLSAQPIVGGGDADGDFVGPGAAIQAVYLQPDSTDQNHFVVGESAGSLQMTVRRSCAALGTVTVSYATQDGADAPAVAGQDYEATSGVLVFADGEVEKTIAIPILDNALYDQPARYFDLILSSPTGAVLGARAVNTIRIDDDDPIPAGSDLQLSFGAYPDPVTAGGDLTYDLYLVNYPTGGGEAAQDVVATTILPAGVAFTSVEMTLNSGGGGGDFFDAAVAGPGGQFAALNQPGEFPDPGLCAGPAVGASGAVVCNLGAFGSAYDGVSASVTIRVSVPPDSANSDLLSTASVATSSFDPFPANNSASVTVHVDGPAVNQPPAAVDDSADLAEDEATVVAVLDNDSDPEGDPLTISAVGAAQHGSVEIDGAAIRYTPVANYNGVDAFTYTIADGQGNSALAMVTVNIAPVNDDPVAVTDSGATPQNTAVAISVLANDSDVDGDSLVVSAVGAAAHGSVTTDGSAVTYTPAAGYTGGDSFEYMVSDGNGGSSVATVQITVTPSQAQPATITISKDAQPDHRRRFRFTGALGNFQLSGDDASPASTRTFTVNAGVYTVTERVPANWLLTDVVCTPAAKAAVDLTANQVVLNASSGDNITCTFINQQVAVVRAFLFHDSNGNGTRQGREPVNTGWTVNLFDGQNQLAASDITNRQGKASFTGLRPGAYTLCEVLQDGLTNVQPCVAFQALPGTTTTVTFANRGAGAVRNSGTDFLMSQITSQKVEDPEVDEDIVANDDAWLNDHAPQEGDESEAANQLYLPVVTR
jgi:hypothetical protein